MNEHFTVLNGRIRFDGNCSETKPFCGAVCCKRTTILLTPEEKNSGQYEYVEPTPDCECQSCRFLRSQNAVAALKRRDDGCIYLDGSGSCSIYENRPQMCRNFNCSSTHWSLMLVK